MDDLTRIFNKIDKIEDNIGSIDKTLIQQHEVLKDHIRRSEANEKAVQIIKDELKPVFFQYSLIKLITKVLLGIIGSGLIIEIIRLFSEG